MSENILREVLEEIYKEEISAIDNLPKLKTSRRHRRAMKRIFTLFEKNSRNTVNIPLQTSFSQPTHMNYKKRLLTILIVIICAALMTGFMAVYVSKSFNGTVYNDNTQLFAVNTEDCPATIEYEYYLSALPDGLEPVEHISSSLEVYTKYKNKISGQVITLSQWTKKNFSPHYNTAYHDFEDIEINGHAGLCIDFSDNEHDSSIVIWDNDDYILELDGDLPKIDLIKLAKSTKVLEI